MRPLTLGLVGVAAYLVFLVASVPASFVAATLERETHGAVRLEAAEGTLWSGTANVAFPVSVEHVQWRWRPASLAAARLGFDIHVMERDLKAAGEVARSLRGWEAHALIVGGAAQRVAQLSPLLAAWRPEGAVAIDVPRLAWTPASLEGSARIEWRGAAISLSDVKPLGAYRAELNASGAEARLAVTTLDGPLRISGTGTLTPAGRLGFRGEARAEGPQAASLQPLLDLLGPRQPNGSRLLGIGSRTDPVPTK